MRHKDSPITDKMTPLELKSSLALALVFFLRMMGLFLILPVFVLYAEHLHGATPTLIGIALGTYGLTQAIFQIPFGFFSDRIDRKSVISAGLVIFMAGSITAALAQSIYIVILGRALQGAGAIAAAIMALAADLTRDTQRSKAMALIGISIGISFSLSFVIGPVLNPYIGVPGLFFMAAGLAVVAIIILYTLVPVPERHLLLPEQHAQAGQIRAVMTDPQLLRLYISIFILHMLLVSSFVAVPHALRDVAGLDSAHHWEVYLPVLVISGLIMVPFLMLGEKYKKVSLIFTGAVALMIIAQFGLYLGHGSILQITLFLLLFFTSFNYLEATLPALITRYAPRTGKGTALGVYSTSQFIGTFCGGMIGGHIFERFGLGNVFLFGGILATVWICALLVMQKPMEHKKL
jgi:predicted MFS family arabinose efflux permease